MHNFCIYIYVFGYKQSNKIIIYKIELGVDPKIQDDSHRPVYNAAKREKMSKNVTKLRFF